MADGFDITKYLADKATYLPSMSELATTGATAIDSALLGGPSAGARALGIDTSPFQRMKEENPNAAAAGELGSLGIMPGMKSLAAGVGGNIMDMLFGGPASAQAAGGPGPFTTTLQKDMTRLQEVTSQMTAEDQGKGKTGKPGQGSSYRALATEKAELESRIRQTTPLAQQEAAQVAELAKLQGQTGLLNAEAQKKQADEEQRSSGTMRQLLIGGAGLGLGGLLGHKFGGMTGNRLNAAAKDVNAFGSRAEAELARAPTIGTKGFDDLTNAVNGGFERSGSTPPFTRAQIAPTLENSDAALTRALNETTGVLPAKPRGTDRAVAADRAAIEAPFQSTVKDPKASLMADYGLPVGLMAEGALTSKVLPDAVGWKEDDVKRDIATGVGQGSFYAAAGSKLGGIMGKAAALSKGAKVTPESKISLSSGRDHVARELAAARSPAALSKVSAEGKIPPSPAVAKEFARASDDAAINRITGAKDEAMLKSLRGQAEQAKLTAESETALTAAEQARNARLKEVSQKGLEAARPAAQAYAKAMKEAVDHPEIGKEVADWLKSKGGQLRQRVDTREFNDLFRDKLGTELKAAQIQKLGSRHSVKATNGIVDKVATEIVGSHAGPLPPMKNRQPGVDKIVKEHGVTPEEADRILVRAYRKARMEAAKTPTP